jgi:hypothetical protein
VRPSLQDRLRTTEFFALPRVTQLDAPTRGRVMVATSEIERLSMRSSETRALPLTTPAGLLLYRWAGVFHVRGAAKKTRRTWDSNPRRVSPYRFSRPRSTVGRPAEIAGGCGTLPHGDRPATVSVLIVAYTAEPNPYLSQVPVAFRTDHGEASTFERQRSVAVRSTLRRQALTEPRKRISWWSTRSNAVQLGGWARRQGVSET